MPIDERAPDIPLADVLRASNGLVTAGLIEDYAFGGALAAIYYVEPFTTNDADVMKLEMRRKLAREPFAEKIRKVGQLIRLAKRFPRRSLQQTATKPGR